MQENIQDIMRYESDIWSVADLLIAASVKQSDFPAFMMPFFAVMMLEGRMRNAAKAVEAEFGVTAAENPDDFREMFLTKDCGFNEFIVIEGKTLAKICANDTTFEQDFKAYLNGFDPDLRRLLGVGCGSQEQKFLNMDGITAELRGKKILMQVAAKWAEIAAFIKKYIFKPCRLGENKVGIELNFNKEFYVPEKLDSVEDILAEIKALDAQLKEVTL